MKTAFLTLALSLFSLPAIATPANYIWLVRNVEENPTIALMSDAELFDVGLLHCDQMQGFATFDQYLAWLEVDAERANLSANVYRILVITAAAADRQLCDDAMVNGGN